MDLTELSWPAVAALSKDTPVVFPIAALEQHGHHLPLFTDSLLLGEVIRRAREPFAQSVLFAPLTWLGNSDHHLEFAGTLSAPPRTYLDLLEGLAEKGFGPEQLAEMQKIIDAEKSDLFDVLANVAYAKPPVTREVRAANAKVHINTRFSAKQQVFLDFVLSHYVSVGVEELDQSKLTPLLRLNYHDSLADAVADLGQPEEIGKVFAGFQKYLYAAPV